jgi:hypothetical protein
VPSLNGGFPEYTLMAHDLDLVIPEFVIGELVVWFPSGGVADGPPR